MDSPPKIVLLAGVLVLLIGFASPAIVDTATAKAPPEPVCGVCTESLEEAAADHGVSLERGQSEMTVQLSQDGTADLFARVELESGADQLRNDSLREAIVRDVSYVLVEERQDLRTAIEDGELRVRYSSRDLAHSTLGVVQFDGFHITGAPLFAVGGEGSPYPGADVLRLRAPPGYRLQGTHGDHSNETTVRWDGDSHERYAGHIEEDITISFVPKQARFPRVRVRTATVLDWFGSLGE